jgi:hypothetical protein
MTEYYIVLESITMLGSEPVPGLLVIRLTVAFSLPARAPIHRAVSMGFGHLNRDNNHAHTLKETKNLPHLQLRCLPILRQPI